MLGGVFEKTILRSPVVLNFTEYVNLGIELEVGVTLGKDLPASGAPYTRETVADAVPRSPRLSRSWTSARPTISPPRSAR